MSTIKIRDIIENASKAKFILPNFQREYTYDRSKQRSLITSVLSFIPLGAIMTLEGEPAMMSYRNIGRRSNAPLQPVTHHQVRFVLDGQQRVTTLWACFTDIFEGMSLVDRNTLREHELSPKLRNRWHLRIVPDNEAKEEDIFGWSFLELRQGQLRQLSPDDLEGRVEYSRSLVDNDNWPWEDYGVLGMPDYTSRDPIIVARRARIESQGLIPIHKIFESHAFVRDIGRHRKMKLFNLCDLIYQNNNTYADCSRDDAETLLKLFGVRDEEGFDQFRDSGLRLQSLEHRLDAWIAEINSYFHSVSEQIVFEIQLEENDLSKAHVIFDVINQAGEKLSVFDLFCAKHPSIEIRSTVLSTLDNYPDSLALLTTDVTPEKRYLDLFMNTLRALNHYHEFSASKFNFAGALKDDIFLIDGGFVQKNVPLVAQAVAESIRFAQDRLGVRKLSEFPYLLQVLPIALGFALRDNNPTQQDQDYFQYSYWFSLFAGRYREGQNKTVGEELEFVARRFGQGQLGLPSALQMNCPWGSRILAYEGYNDREYLKLNPKDDIVGDGVKKALTQFVLSLVPYDFPSSVSGALGQISAASDELELHHIVPIASVATITQSSRKIRRERGGPINSPLNLTFISKKSNRYVGAMHPTTYSSALGQNIKDGHCLGRGPIVQVNLNQQQDLINWLDERFNAINARLRATLNTLVNHL